MKKRKQKKIGSLSQKISNRLSYTIIAFVGLMLVGVFIFAAPNPGHDYDELDLGPITINGNNVGIGATSANSKLSVGGAGSSDYAIYGAGSDYGVYGFGNEMGVYGIGNTGVYGFGDTYDFYAGGGSTSYFSGKVGIGDNTPSEKLEVAGNIKATGTICDSTGCISSGGGGTPTLAQVLAAGNDAGGSSISSVGNLYLKEGGSINTYYGAIEIKGSNIDMRYGGSILNAGTVQANTLEDPDDGDLTVNDNLFIASGKEIKGAVKIEQDGTYVCSDNWQTLHYVGDNCVAFLMVWDMDANSEPQTAACRVSNGNLQAINKEDGCDDYTWVRCGAICGIAN